MAYKKIFSKLNLILVMLAFTAGVIFLSCGFCSALPKNVTVNGVDVGGLPRNRALQILRERTVEELKQKELIINCKNREYVFTYPEINFKDNLYSLLKTAKKGDSLTAETSYYLCGINEVVSGICQNENVAVEDPSAKFVAGKSPFEYTVGRDGVEIDKARLIEDMRVSLKNGFTPVTAAYVGVKRKTTLESVKKNTALLSRFTTYYDGDNLARSSNIRLAAAHLNGTVVESKKTLSFNDIVGSRTKSRGFLPAKIIENGEFTEGVGGGVCQVSTTLYNAALLSGLKISEYHPHSLSVSYVPPSRDAMVSGTACDLKITNPYGCPVYICARTGKNYVTFEIYGRFDGVTYSLASEVTGNLPAPEEITGDPEKARAGKDGFTSQSFLLITRNGYTKRVFLRKDKYLPVKSLVYESAENEEAEA